MPTLAILQGQPADGVVATLGPMLITASTLTNGAARTVDTPAERTATLDPVKRTAELVGA